MKKTYLLFLLGLYFTNLVAQQSVARQWNEAIIQSIREDRARPPIAARTLFYTSMAMYDAWAAFDTTGEAKPYLLGNTVGGQLYQFNGITITADIESARREAICYAAYRIARQKFVYSPNGYAAYLRFNDLMFTLGYDINFTSTDYSTGSAAALGNYIAQNVILLSYQDGANEINDYTNQNYYPINQPLTLSIPGNQMVNPNNWQPLNIAGALDQNGNPIPSIQSFQSPEWGRVLPFAMDEGDRTNYQRNNWDYPVYHDPGPPLMLNLATADNPNSKEFKWNHSMVAAWASHLDPNDGVMWDISPASIGNLQSYPHSIEEYHQFYDFENGGDHSPGHAINPATSQPYTPQIVPRGDYTRVLSQFWADGPNSETPPGHWYVILNHYVNDHPGLVRKFGGNGSELNPLEWDVKAYFTLGAALHDAAISAWGIKGWYDAVRPVSTIRYMGAKGQSSDPSLPSYNPAGLELVPGFVELVQVGDTLAGASNQHVGKVKLFTWRGHSAIQQPALGAAGAGWILAENWDTYQRKTFVTPPFGGYISGHSTYSRAAAEVLTNITGSRFFPGGMAEVVIPANSGFLLFEQGPSVDVKLQWATYRDASDQTSLSRIWGGIHPPFDDMPGRFIGARCGEDAFHLAKTYFYADNDVDGYFSYEDCDDSNATIYPGAPELCDGIDNNCNGLSDEELTQHQFFVDTDGDGFGSEAIIISTCIDTIPAGYSMSNTDCDDTNAAIYPGAPELCDGIDNDCNGTPDDGLTQYLFYVDTDGDGFGSETIIISTCMDTIPAGYSMSNTDCDDANAAIYPGASELCDGIDNDCNGTPDDGLTQYLFYVDTDGDGFGSEISSISSCMDTIPTGYSMSNVDCDDNNASIYPGALELCDGIDNNCDGQKDEGFPIVTYYADVDNDGYGNSATRVDTCLSGIPVGFVINDLDCNDDDALVNPNGWEVPGDGIDNNCDGMIDNVSSIGDIDNGLFRVYPNPVSSYIIIDYPRSTEVDFRLITPSGKLLSNMNVEHLAHQSKIDCHALPSGIYFLQVTDRHSGENTVVKIIHK